MTTTLRVPRSRGALSGLLLVLLGLWGALMPLIGPYFHFGFAPDKAWDVTSGRIWLQIVPGVAVFLGGLITLTSANRAFAAFGAWLAAVGGAWFVVGVPLSALWADRGRMQLGQALGDTTKKVTEQLTLLYGFGAVAVFLAAVALGRLAVIGVKDARLAEQDAEPVSEDETATAPRPALAHRRRADAETAEGQWQRQRVPRTSAEAPTTGPADVRVAGPAGDKTPESD